MSEEERTKKLSGWADIVTGESLTDEALVTRVFYEGAPAIAICSGGKIEWSTIQPRDYWATEGVDG